MMTPGSELILRAPLDAVEAHRNRAVELFAEAFDALAAARAEMALAGPSTAYPGHLPDALHTKLCGRTYSTPSRDEFLEAATLQVDRVAWRHLLNVSGLERLMDQKAKREFHRQIDEAPPPATVETCHATMQDLFANAGSIFRRGIAETFSALDRRFKSHDGFKVGARIVLTRAMTEYGSWNHYAKADDALRDVERVFRILDGQQQPDYDAGILGVVSKARPRSLSGAAFFAEDAYFRVRIFKNGNAHVWFKRDDLLERVNQLLADHYGAALGDARRSAAAKPGARGVARKSFDFFPSPAPVVERVRDEAWLRTAALTVLEPSAGAGAIALAAADAGAIVTVVEIQSALSDQLQATGRFKRVIEGDFLDLTPDQLGRFDRVLMNPPFGGRADIEHVCHAMRFVAPGGRLVAVMSAGVAFREDAATVAFRDQVQSAGGRIVDLPAGSFAEVGTNVNTCLVTIPFKSFGG